MYNVVRMILTTSLFFIFFFFSKFRRHLKSRGVHDCRVGGENHGADLHQRREGKGVGVGFLSQIPWGLEIQEGG